ncbi:RHS repeat-associated core domain-containing protein, partial [Delftia sp. ZNC0008]
DPLGKIDWHIELDPWGNCIREYNPSHLHQPIRMQGQHLDEESGLFYNRHRYYDPALGRYISRDPIGLMGGINGFSYAGGNPSKFTDPLGLCDCDNILDQAQKLVGDTRYKIDGYSRPGPGKNKCNFFVDDVLQHTDASPARNIFGMPIAAGTWANPDISIPNFPIVETPQAGDVVAIAHRYADASGHVAIVEIPGETSIGTGPNGSGRSGWPWDVTKQPQGTPVYRRCTCP